MNGGVGIPRSVSNFSRLELLAITSSSVDGAAVSHGVSAKVESRGCVPKYGSTSAFNGSSGAYGDCAAESIPNLVTTPGEIFSSCSSTRGSVVDDTCRVDGEKHFRGRRSTLSPTGGSVDTGGMCSAHTADALEVSLCHVTVTSDINEQLAAPTAGAFPHLSQFMRDVPPSSRSASNISASGRGILEENVSVNTVSNLPDLVAHPVSQNCPETQGTPMMWELRMNSISRPSAHFLTCRTSNSGRGDHRLQWDEVETTLTPLTVRRGIPHHPQPRIHARSLFRLVCAVLFLAVVLPLVLICIVFGVYYLTIKGLLIERSNHSCNANCTGAVCANDFAETQRYVFKGFARESFIFAVGLTMAIIIIVIGGVLLLWAFLWHYVHSPYLRVLLFIRGASSKLSKIEPLTREQLSLVPKMHALPFFFGRRKKRPVVEGLVDKVVTLGNTLQELRRYVPHLERSGILSVVVNGHRCDTTASAHTGERQSDCPSHRSKRTREGLSSPPSLREEVMENISNSSGGGLIPTNPFIVDTTSPPSARRNTLVFVPNNQRVDESWNSLDDIPLMELDDSEITVSPSRSHFSHYVRPNSSSPNTTPGSSAAVVVDGGVVVWGQTSNKECGLFEGFEAKNGVLNDYGCLVQQVTFLVCRLFLPKLEFLPNGGVTNRSAKLTQEMSRRFLRVVLRVAREEYGVPFDIRLDSVVVTFHTPSGPNSVNLVQPRNCAFRLVSELAKLESRWMRTSSTPFVWGIAMHLSQLMIGLSGAGSGHVTLMYGEEVKLASRVADLCRVLNCPLLMLQPCYDVFRVCMTAVPVDAIYKDTSDGKVRIYLYDPKAPVEEEDLYSRREQYKPLTEAFGLMCEKRFTEASKQLEKLVDLDHNVCRLYRLCTCFSQQQREGKIEFILPSNTKYVRQGPRWECMEEEAQKFVQEYQSHQYLLPAVLRNDSINSPPHFTIDGNEASEANEVMFENSSCVTSPWNGFRDFSFYAHNLSPPMHFSTPTVPPSLATPSSLHAYDCESPVAAGIRGAGMMENGDSHEVCVRRSQRVPAWSSVFSDTEFDGDSSLPHIVDINGSSIYSKDDDDDEDVEGKMEFDIYEPLGRGSFGTVYRGLHPDGNIVAIKEYPVPDMDENNPQIQSSRSEIEMLACCRHKNIVRYINSCFQSGSLYIITEFVSGGSLSALVKTFHYLPLDTIRRYTGDILRGLQYLHDRQIVHRDISPNNVLVSIDGVCKLSDFGGAVEYAMQTTTIDPDTSVRTDLNSFTYNRRVTFSAEDPQTTTATTTTTTMTTGTVLLKKCFGTPVCMSPEACSGIVDPKNDIWGLGITLCFCFSGRYPWPEEEMMKDAVSFISKVRRGVLTPDVPYDMMGAQAADFIRLCLRRDASSRPTAAELFFHAFMVN